MSTNRLKELLQCINQWGSLNRQLEDFSFKPNEDYLIICKDILDELERNYEKFPPAAIHFSAEGGIMIAFAKPESQNYAYIEFFNDGDIVGGLVPKSLSQSVFTTKLDFENKETFMEFMNLCKRFIEHF